MAEAEYRLSPKALNDLEEIWKYLAPLNEKAAEALFESFHEKITAVLDFPMRGAPRPHLGPKARILIAGQYVIVYEPAEFGIFVVTIVHGRKRPDDWLKSDKR